MSDNRIIECMERAQYLLGNLMAVKPGEEVLIVVDPQTDERMTQAMAAAALNCGAEYGVYMMPIRGKDKATIFPKSLELGMDACDVFVGMTTASGAAIYNNHLKELINQKKLREVSICLRNIDNFTRGGALADYEAVYADGEKLQAIWRGHKMAHITTPAGTDLYMEMNQMEPIIECGPLSGKSRIIRYRQFTILLTYPKNRPVISECRSRKQIKTITPFRQPNGLSVTPHAVLRFLRTKRKFNISAGDRIG